MIFGSRKGGIVLEEPQISVPFPSKLLEFGVARGRCPLAYRNFVFGQKAKYAFKVALLAKS